MATSNGSGLTKLANELFGKFGWDTDEETQYVHKYVIKTGLNSTNRFQLLAPLPPNNEGDDSDGLPVIISFTNDSIIILHDAVTDSDEEPEFVITTEALNEYIQSDISEQERAIAILWQKLHAIMINFTDADAENDSGSDDNEEDYSDSDSD